MAFHTIQFAIFLIVTLSVSWALMRARMLRLVFLLLASWFFYMNSKMEYIGLILASTCVDYVCGLRIFSAPTQRQKKAWLTLSLSVNLGMLGTFKYYDWLLDSFRTVALQLNMISPDYALPFLEAALPVGISFYTFQTMAYSIDVYRGHQEPVRNFWTFSLFVTFFPQLVAGPIVLATHMLPQFERPPKVTKQQVSDGVFLIMKGLVKKLAIADFLALNLIDRVYDNPGLYSSGEVLLALYAYSMQIYCDFSGYTDLAIGTAKLFGYELPENFNRPYQAESVAKFWRRWHITLSTWVRHYIYFPLGGTHKGELRAYLNVMAALVIMGIWHGANWTFFWYGVIHGLVVGMNRYHNQKRKRLGTPYELRGLKLVWRVLLTLTFVSLARILFRGQDLSQCWRITDQLLGTDWSFGHIHWKIWLVMGVSYLVHFLPRRWIGMLAEQFRVIPAVIQGLVLAVVLGWMVHLANTQPVPFIYFAF